MKAIPFLNLLAAWFIADIVTLHANLIGWSSRALRYCTFPPDVLHRYDDYLGQLRLSTIVLATVSVIVAIICVRCRLSYRVIDWLSLGVSLICLLYAIIAYG